ncbi:flagellar basal body rod protein FlgB [Brevundimonas sp.]|uniref:flagellar basal body rod protein FlgB n=1 Tax=Brevundimonas sp. TaxID=1871086 RepID=UPI0025CF3518|nr:flagellar basal body rod protein FlgB [Brevundimonas sp.]
MGIDGIPLFSMLRGRLSWLGERQRVVAENVANADTPGYAARDLSAPADFARALDGARGVGLMRTSGMHMASPTAAATPFTAEVSPDSETTPDGNSVVVEEQMLRMAESRMAYDAAIGFYQKSLNMLRLAARATGR